jgi:hypothetical protein
MDHQGSGRTRPAADTRGQAPWPWLGSTDEPASPANPADPASAQPVLGRGSGAQPVLGSGAQPVLGSGAQPVLGSGSGAQPVLGSGAQPVLGSGAQPVLGLGSGAQRVLGPGTGPQRLIGSGSGAYAVLGTGAQPAPSGPSSPGSPGFPGRTPARGFPPGRGPADPPEGGSGSWLTPREPRHGDDDDTADGGYGAAGPGEDSVLWDDTARFGRIAPPDPTAPAGRAGRRRGVQATPKSRRRSRIAMLAMAAVVVVAAAAFTGYKFLYEPRVNAPVPATLRLPTSGPASPGFDQSLGKWQHIGTRTEDPEPLTIGGLYPPQFELNGSSYVRTAASVTKNCSQAVYGDNLQAALQSGHCTQVARASYISGDSKVMGTVGVVNLSTSAAAQKAGQATGPQEIIAPLTAQKGLTKKLGSGTGVVQAEVKGHYLILIWAQFTNLKSPSTSAARQQLEQFAGNLVTGTANINLSTRMLSGKATVAPSP